MFKVGDKVLGLNAWISLYVQEVTDVYEGYVVLDTGSKCKDSALRHATPEEIAAGHRIDTNTGVTVITPSGTSKVKGGLTAFVDMGDDSHIENHVSPNCKVGVK